ncbi:PHD finger protein 10 [Labeo rohita]|uniref:PHD finger protein 10 n=1 Tax=Labeo rohita TaxID=84645 RepID=A0ABQ8M3R8_LABRO|nr:PHD finger protein 10 [Labeo rohita]
MAAVLSPRPCDSNPATPGTQSVKDDIEENSSDGSQAPKRRRMGSGDSSRSCDTSSHELGPTYFPAENLTEYKWPPDDTGEYYMLQEQVSEYLGVTSFKRKYPGMNNKPAEKLSAEKTELNFHFFIDLERRDLSHKEKLYLREQNVITETQCTLGLTALRSDEVIDLMIKEYPVKHAEYSVEASKVPEYIKKAAKKAAEFNSNFNRERMEERRAYFDLQTHIIQVPQGRYKVLPPEKTKTGPYPVALIPGQFQEYYKRYSPNELRYLPLNTALYEPPLDPELPALDRQFIRKHFRWRQPRQRNSIQSQEQRRHFSHHPAQICPWPKVIPNAICGICQKGKEANKRGKPEALIHCSQCQNSGHPSCLDMSVELVSQIKMYPWQCMECKTCTVCEQPHHEEEMMFCDKCDRGFHTFCVGMDSIPLGCWVCDLCSKELSTPQKKGTTKTPKKSK